jgi:hypothetical protein
MFSAIQENTLHIFGAINFLCIPIVWAFYPETANRTLEEIDLLFASESVFVWDAEENFAKLKAEHREISHLTEKKVGGGVVDDEKTENESSER